MPKAVLVMDMPESCFGCNFLYCNADAGIDSCQAMEVSRIVDSETYERPDWCPLRRRWKCVGSTRSHVSLSRRIDLVGMLV